MNFNSSENKYLLWNILQENGSFKQIETEKVSLVKNDFETLVNTIQNKANSETPLMTLNKEFIATMINILNKYKVETLTISESSTGHRREDLIEKRQTMFEQRLKTRQEEFSQMINADKPKEVDFSDSNTMYNQNIDKLMEKTLEQRTTDISSLDYSHNTGIAEKWISGESGNRQISIDQASNMKINDIIPLQTSQASSTPDKQVTWADNNESSFLSKLKVVKSGQENIDAEEKIFFREKLVEIQTQLNDMQEQQNQILELLGKIIKESDDPSTDIA